MGGHVLSKPGLHARRPLHQGPLLATEDTPHIDGGQKLAPHQHVPVAVHKVPGRLHHFFWLPGRLEAGVAGAVCFLGWGERGGGAVRQLGCSGKEPPPRSDDTQSKGTWNGVLEQLQPGRVPKQNTPNLDPQPVPLISGRLFT